MKQAIDTLIPVDLYNDVKLASGNRFKSTTVLKASNGTVITKDLPESWLIYMKYAINNYDNMLKQAQLKPIDNPAIVSITLTGTPITRKDGKTVEKNSDGTFSLCPNKEFKIRYMYLKSQLENILRYKETLFPIKIPVVITFEFHMFKTNKHHNLAELISSTIELMVKLKLLKNSSSKIVARVDGSKICYTYANEKTVVTIKKLIGGIP